ncbi:unnamed protein product [Linum tenue]|uniref:DUF3615 domain-containing protein n=1 Tax=Linum tenue TaxID=586396 RepID=A0AAV0REQ5_9ROSI|nr:unnamed protein product [Linum tenue]
MDTAATSSRSERSPRSSFIYRRRRGSRRRSGNNLSVDEVREDEKTIKKLKLENRKLRRRFVEESEDLRLVREQFQQQLVIMRAMKMQLDNVASSTTKFQKSAEVEIAAKLGETMQQMRDFKTYQKAILKIAQTIVDPPAPESSDDEEEEIPPRTLAQQNLFYSEKVLEKYNCENPGAEFVIAEALVTYPFNSRGTWIIHLNFTAKDKAGNVHRLFGETTVELKPGDPVEVLSYCILTPSDNGDYSSLTKGCRRCDPTCFVPIYHPDESCFKRGHFNPHHP